MNFSDHLFNESHKDDAVIDRIIYEGNLVLSRRMAGINMDVSIHFVDHLCY